MRKSLREICALAVVSGLVSVSAPAAAQQELLSAETTVTTIVVDGSQQQSIPVSFHVKDATSPMATYRLGLRHTTLGVLPFSPSRHDVPNNSRHEYQATRSLTLPVTAIPGEYELVAQLVSEDNQTAGWLSAPSPSYITIEDPRSWQLNYCRDSRHDQELLIDVPGDWSALDLVCVCEEDASGCSPIPRDACAGQPTNRNSLPVVLQTSANEAVCVYRLGSIDSSQLVGNRFNAYWARRIIPETISQISDSEFNSADWVSMHCPDVRREMGQSSFTAGQTTTEGNQAPSYAVSHEFNLRIAVCHLYQGGEVDLADSAISSFDFAFDTQRIGSRGVAVYPLIMQDGTVYWGKPSATAGRGLTSFAETLEVTDFTPVYSDPSSTQHPDFSCGAPPITIGFVTANQIGPTSTPVTYMLSRSAYVDNWSFEAIGGAPCD